LQVWPCDYLSDRQLPFKASLLRDEVENEFWDEVHRELKPLIEAAESGDKAAIAEAFGEFAP